MFLFFTRVCLLPGHLIPSMLHTCVAQQLHSEQGGLSAPPWAASLFPFTFSLYFFRELVYRHITGCMSSPPRPLWRSWQPPGKEGMDPGYRVHIQRATAKWKVLEQLRDKDYGWRRSFWGKGKCHTMKWARLSKDGRKGSGVKTIAGQYVCGALLEVRVHQCWTEKPTDFCVFYDRGSTQNYSS